MCKCPNEQVMESSWHPENNKMNGVDFRYIYEFRKKFWLCDTYVPSKERFLQMFRLLGGHIPTTGFSCILEFIQLECSEIYLTGFDFFTSKKHNINEAWQEGRPDDPIRHVPEKEAAWLKKHWRDYPFTLDLSLKRLIDA